MRIVVVSLIVLFVLGVAIGVHAQQSPSPVPTNQDISVNDMLVEIGTMKLQISNKEAYIKKLQQKILEQDQHIKELVKRIGEEADSKK